METMADPLDLDVFRAEYDERPLAWHYLSAAQREYLFKQALAQIDELVGDSCRDLVTSIARINQLEAQLACALDTLHAHCSHNPQCLSGVLPPKRT